MKTLDPADWQRFRRQAHVMLDDILGHVESIREQKLWQPLHQEFHEAFAGNIPSDPSELSVVHAEFLQHILPFSSGNSHPGFMGWVQGGGTPVGMLAELLAAGLNSNLGGRAHAAIEVEREVSEWVRQLFGFPDGARGLFVSGTSMANLTAVKVARDVTVGIAVRRLGMAASPTKLTAYASKAVHSCIPKALDVCGLGSDSLRLIATDNTHRIDLRELEERIDTDRRAGFNPFLIVGNAGTVDIGAIDDLKALADLAERQRIWFHVDGAFAAMAILADDLAPLLDGVQRADSLAFDFHKWAQVPYSAGFLLVRDGKVQRDSFSISPAYLRRESRGVAAGADWPCDFGVDLSRGFQALKTWFTFKVYGTRAIGAVISRCCELARYLADEIALRPELELMAPVQLNIVCFRYRAIQADRLNARIAIDLQETGLVAPSTTVLDGKLVIRAAIVNHRTERRDVDLLIEETLKRGRTLTQHGELVGKDGDWEPHATRLAELEKLQRAIEGEPREVELHVARADILADLGRLQEARDEYLAVLAKEPAHRATLNHLGTLLYGTGYRSAAQTAFAEAVRHYPQDLESLINLANVLMDDGQAEKARDIYSGALRIDPEEANAHQGMARALAELGDEAGAEVHRQAGFDRCSLTTLPYRGSKAPVKVLLMVSAVGGSPPVRHFLDDATFQTAVLTAEYFKATEPLPAHHLVFNAIGDAELAERALYAAEYLLARSQRPVINAPRAVLATGRADNARRLSGLSGVVTPITVTLPKDLLKTATATILARHGLQFPLLLRTPGFHTGQHFMKVESSADVACALARLPGSSVTAIQFLDARGRDEKSRKYRVMMIDGKLYPLHLASSSNWKIHYFTAEMADSARHRAEDEAFLGDMPSVLGERAMAALVHIQNALGLDYAGIDFGLNEAGEVLLFEANATMVVPRPADGEKWVYRRNGVEAIHTAVRRMLLQRADAFA